VKRRHPLTLRFLAETDAYDADRRRNPSPINTCSWRRQRRSSFPASHLARDEAIEIRLVISASGTNATKEDKKLRSALEHIADVQRGWRRPHLRARKRT
jgi:hypothetical protein